MTGKTNTHEEIVALILQLASEFQGVTSEDNLRAFRVRSTNVLISAVMSVKSCEFHKCMKTLSEQHDTISFWYQFLSVDMLCLYCHFPFYTLLELGTSYKKSQTPSSYIFSFRSTHLSWTNPTSLERFAQVTILCFTPSEKRQLQCSVYQQAWHSTGWVPRNEN